MLASSGGSGGSGGSGAGGASAAAAATSRHRAWYHNAALHYAIALVAVFVTSLILLVLIQPPFVQAQPEDKLRAKQFHGGRAAVAAAIATAFAGVIMLIVFGVTRRKGRK
jgi:membrane protein implicated in regulation of membrane protease activity